MPNPLTYLDFEIDVYPDESHGDYVVAVVRSPAGEARESSSLPFGELELKNRLLELQNALLRSGGPRRRGPAPHELPVQSFGRELFDFLLPGEVRSLYRNSREKAIVGGLGLRLKLRIQDPALAALPWEYLFDPVHNEYLCLSTQTPLVRYLELAHPPRPFAIEPPLRVLGMIASPEGVEPLKVDLEKQRVEEALADLQADGLVELHWLPGQTWRHLQREMRKGPWHIFHYIGHGRFDPLHNEGQLILADRRGQAAPLNAEQLARLLADHSSLRLALLNACEGASASPTDLFSGTAASLMRRGIPAVLAMQQEITDAAAIELTTTLYEALADGYPVDAAVAEARKAISLAVSHSVEWGTPVLHMRAPDGQVFAVSPFKEGILQDFTRERVTSLSPSPSAITANLGKTDGAKNEGGDQGHWFPPIEEEITLDSLLLYGTWNEKTGTWSPGPSDIDPVIGVVDMPGEGLHSPLTVNLSEGHLAIYGAPGYGKTTLVQTLIVSIAKLHSPEEVNIYVLDFGGQSLRQQFAGMPHLGAIVSADEEERIYRLFALLRQEMVMRQEILGLAEVSSLREYRKQGNQDIPAIVFILENYAGFIQDTQDNIESYQETITRISREGIGLGIHLVLTSSSPTEIRHSVANNILHAIVLHLTDESEYRTVVGRIKDAIPPVLPGRGLVRNSPIALGCQIAVPVEGGFDQRRSSQLFSLSKRMSAGWLGRRARPVLTLPDEIPIESLLSSCQAGDSLQAPLGLRVQDLEIFAPSLSDSTVFLVTGSTKSGKSSLLLNWILGLDRLYGQDHVQVYVFDSIAKPLGGIQDLESVRGYASFAQQAISVFGTLTQEISARVEAARTDNSAISDSRRIVIVIDDLGRGEDELGSLPKSLQEQLATVVRRSQLARTTLIVAADTGDIYSAYSDTVRLLKEAQTGFILGESDDRVFVNMRLPHSERYKTLPPGEGYFVRRGQAIRIKFATPQRQES